MNKFVTIALTLAELEHSSQPNLAILTGLCALCPQQQLEAHGAE